MGTAWLGVLVLPLVPRTAFDGLLTWPWWALSLPIPVVPCSLLLALRWLVPQRGWQGTVSRGVLLSGCIVVIAVWGVAHFEDGAFRRYPWLRSLEPDAPLFTVPFRIRLWAIFVWPVIVLLVAVRRARWVAATAWVVRLVVAALVVHQPAPVYGWLVAACELVAAALTVQAGESPRPLRLVLAVLGAVVLVAAAVVFVRGASRAPALRGEIAPTPQWHAMSIEERRRRVIGVRLVPSPGPVEELWDGAEHWFFDGYRFPPALRSCTSRSPTLGRPRRRSPSLRSSWTSRSRRRWSQRSTSRLRWGSHRCAGEGSTGSSSWRGPFSDRWPRASRRPARCRVRTHGHPCRACRSTGPGGGRNGACTAASLSHRATRPLLRPGRGTARTRGSTLRIQRS